MVYTEDEIDALFVVVPEQNCTNFEYSYVNKTLFIRSTKLTSISVPTFVLSHPKEWQVETATSSSMLLPLQLPFKTKEIDAIQTALMMSTTDKNNRI